ncbi:hypothetical protein [Gordonia zhaorongruii]|uniref:hypothetical protein n=1 Tax=Gordonia zhaorongruii TaxID=2597659 RepID=UPI001046BA4C|nr:hypothetical protein [Gordonia zhaorongruii]
MSAPLRDLDDVEALIAADRDGLLRSAAMSGAHVRAVAQAVSEGVLAPLADLQPRAVVIVTGTSSTARRAADLVVALLASHLDVPLVVAPALPGWIGPLDVVVVAGDDPADRNYTDAALRALRRRAELVTAVPVEGPLADAVGGERIVNLAPRLPSDVRFTFIRLSAVFVAVCSAFDRVRLHPSPPDLADIADLIDEEAAADRPDHESFRNQAKSLAMRVDGRPVAWAGDTPATAVIAAHVAATLFAVAGVTSVGGDEASVLTRVRADAQANGDSNADSIFYDPDFDPEPVVAPRVMLITTQGRSRWVEQRMLGLGDVDVVTERTGAAAADAAADGRPPIDHAYGDVPADLSAYAVTVTRADLAAAYLGLSGPAAERATAG